MLGQRVHSGADVLGIGLHQMWRGLAMGLGLNVSREQVHAVGDALGLLGLSAGGRYETRGQSGGACCKGIALEHDTIHAQAVQGQRGREATSACAHDDHRRVVHSLQISSLANLRQRRVHGFSPVVSKKWRCP